MDNSISLVGADYQEDLIGSDLVIMGNEFYQLEILLEMVQMILTH